MKIIFIFIDGFGLGIDDENINPIFNSELVNMRKIFKKYIVVPTDACLGVEGLPQSATGQTTILTGENAPKILGRHLHGQPTITLKNLLLKDNLFKILKANSISVTNANVYRDKYLEQIYDSKDRRLRPSASTLACMAAGIPFRTVEDLKRGDGIYHDIINRTLIKSGYDVELMEPEIAAQTLVNISRDFDFTFFEYFMSDIVGHKQDRAKSKFVLNILDRFLGELDTIINFKENLLVITSDHGNIEDLTVKTHTFNKVPTIFYGKDAPILSEGINSLMDITPMILKAFNLNRK